MRPRKISVANHMNQTITHRGNEKNLQSIQTTIYTTKYITKTGQKTGKSKIGKKVNTKQRHIASMLFLLW